MKRMCGPCESGCAALHVGGQDTRSRTCARSMGPRAYTCRQAGRHRERRGPTSYTCGQDTRSRASTRPSPRAAVRAGTAPLPFPSPLPPRRRLRICARPLGRPRSPLAALGGPITSVVEEKPTHARNSRGSACGREEARTSGDAFKHEGGAQMGLECRNIQAAAGKCGMEESGKGVLVLEGVRWRGLTAHRGQPGRQVVLLEGDPMEGSHCSPWAARPPRWRVLVSSRGVRWRGPTAHRGQPGHRVAGPLGGSDGGVPLPTVGSPATE